MLDEWANISYLLGYTVVMINSLHQKTDVIHQVLSAKCTVLSPLPPLPLTIMKGVARLMTRDSLQISTEYKNVSILSPYYAPRRGPF